MQIGGTLWHFSYPGLTGDEKCLCLAEPRFVYGSIVFFKNHIIECMAVGLMLPVGRVCFLVLMISAMILMIKGAIGGNGTDVDFSVVVVRHQIMSQKNGKTA